MKELVVLSGKGGTGKTSIVGSFAAIAKNKVLADCDVDAADLHLLLNPTTTEEQEFWSGQVALIDEDNEGCGFCYNVCPDEAIEMRDCLSGHWFISQTRYGPLVHAKLGIAEENSGKLVALVRQNAKLICEKEGLEYIITDGPPGIGCPVISSLSGANLALLVTEPTLSGIHDLERVLGVCHHFGVPALVCVNKYDINEENTRHIEKFCNSQGVDLASKIPLDNIVTEALIRNLPVVEYSHNGVSREIERLWENIYRKLKG
jgi:MinD superfamily P-loop ATPase